MNEQEEADRQWWNGRYCSGCQATVDVNSLGYCASCMAAEEQFGQDLRDGKIEFDVPANPQVGDVIKIKRK